MANGFVTSRPARPGATAIDTTANSTHAQKFTCGGSNGVTYDVVELGWYLSTDAGTTGVVTLAIFEDDAANGCPGAMVANSDGEITVVNDTSVLARYLTYSGTKPQVVGGTAYFLAALWKDANINRDRVASTGGTGVRINLGITYPTWPTDTQWHTHTDVTDDHGIYAVYQAAGGTAFTREITDSLGIY